MMGIVLAVVLPNRRGGRVPVAKAGGKRIVEGGGKGRHAFKDAVRTLPPPAVPVGSQHSPI